MHNVIFLIPDKNAFFGRDFNGARAIINNFNSKEIKKIELRCDFQNLETGILGIDHKNTCVVSTPNCGYLLQLNYQDNKGKFFNSFLHKSDKVNFFKKHRIKTYMLWDDPLGQFTQAICDQNPLNLNQNENGVLKNIKSYFQKWDCLHFGWDSGHIEWVKRLNIINEKNIKFLPLPAHQEYIRPNCIRKTVRQVAFFGNIYLSMINKDLFFQNDKIKKICELILNENVFSFQCNQYEKFKQILNSVFCVRNNLWEDIRKFWLIYRKVIWYFYGTHKRKNILEKISHSVDFFGNFADPDSAAILPKNLHFQKTLDFFSEMPEAFEETEVTVDILNSISINGLTGKFYECFASNGFMLVDYKPDAESVLGKELAAKISYRTIEELNDKISFYLENKKEREEVRVAIKELVLKNCTPQRWSQKILNC